MNRQDCLMPECFCISVAITTVRSDWKRASASLGAMNPAELQMPESQAIDCTGRPGTRPQLSHNHHSSGFCHSLAITNRILLVRAQASQRITIMLKMSSLNIVLKGFHCPYPYSKKVPPRIWTHIVLNPSISQSFFVCPRLRHCMGFM